MADFRSIGRYAICGEIAAGGMATVHFGRLLGSGGFARTVAIKYMHRQLCGDPEFVAMFLDEAWLAARIQHPNVVQTLDVVNTDGELFLVMEYVHGETLARIFRTMRELNQAMPPRIISSIIAGALHGLHAAHEAKDETGKPLNIVHRDVSPQNVIVGADGVSRVLDFGIAKAAVRVHVTRDGTVKGKLAYMAPEQLGSHVVTRASDVYAASVLLWQGLVGKRLFEADTEGRLVAMVMAGKIPRPSTIVSSIPSALEAIVMRGVAFVPEDRFATAREMALALERETEMAMPSEVGEWIEKMAPATLARLAAGLANVESQANLPRPNISEVKAVTEQSRAREGARAWAAGVAPSTERNPATWAPTTAEPPLTRGPSAASAVSAPVSRPVTLPPASGSRKSGGPPTVIPAAPVSTGTARLKRRRILVVDDNEVLLAKARAALEAEGYRVLVTTQTASITRYIPNCDLAIIDVHMPGIADGELLSSLRATLTSGQPCLFWMHTDDPDIAKDFEKLGFDGSITEKGDDAALLRQVRAVLNLLPR